MEYKIDLAKHRSGESKVFTGRERGKTVRSSYISFLRKIDQIENVEVIIPEDIYSLNDSFFLGLFGPTIRTLGEKAFRTKFVFKCSPLILNDIESGISYALKTKTVFDYE